MFESESGLDTRFSGVEKLVGVETTAEDRMETTVVDSVVGVDSTCVKTVLGVDVAFMEGGSADGTETNNSSLVL